MFKTLEYLRFINALNGIISIVICISYMFEPLNSFDIYEPTEETEIILNLHSNIYFFIAMMSFLSLRYTIDELIYINRLHIIHCIFMIVSNVYLYWESVLSTWTTLMMNLTVLSMYLLPFLPTRIQQSGSLTLGSENDENVF